jgi:hypothetical protein
MDTDIQLRNTNGELFYVTSLKEACKAVRDDHTICKISFEITPNVRIRLVYDEDLDKWENVPLEPKADESPGFIDRSPQSLSPILLKELQKYGLKI